MRFPFKFPGSRQQRPDARREWARVAHQRRQFARSEAAHTSWIGTLAGFILLSRPAHP